MKHGKNELFLPSRTPMAVDKHPSSDLVDPIERLYRTVLVVRCQAGDSIAFEELIGAYQSRLRYFLLRMTEDEHDADDLSQAVWLEVYQGLARLKDPGA